MLEKGQSTWLSSVYSTLHQSAWSRHAHCPSISFIQEKVYEERIVSACKGGNKSLIVCKQLTKELIFVCYKQQ
jgi:hypothetical protein